MRFSYTFDRHHIQWQNTTELERGGMAQQGESWKFYQSTSEERAKVLQNLILRRPRHRFRVVSLHTSFCSCRIHGTQKRAPNRCSGEGQKQENVSLLGHRCCFRGLERGGPHCCARLSTSRSWSIVLLLYQACGQSIMSGHLGGFHEGYELVEATDVGTSAGHNNILIGTRA